ncbi:hypothetical protein CABS01_14038 [Colletotrichum abscissum]|uniref:Uncharacterized protein n=1 Tax=Colletotrichum abscissum TaxID=1671311 RepID=A0A9P9WZZ0_9PEZI|nr:uncharacterized protein CABS01_14038 [Colletotrichum abscissum]KAI3528729.1 hypothetical protein CABS02_15041 [Colletotrichum abscissum]KAK1482340.1 hypothetical protein CABS01_14038 [Colletotrichum abscissum]
MTEMRKMPIPRRVYQSPPGKRLLRLANCHSNHQRQLVVRQGDYPRVLDWQRAAQREGYRRELGWQRVVQRVDCLRVLDWQQAVRREGYRRELG